MGFLFSYVVLMQDLTKYMDVSWNLKPTAHITGSKIKPSPGMHK